MAFVGLVLQTDESGRVWHLPSASWRVGMQHPPESFLSMLHGTQWTGMIFRSEVLCSVGGLDEQAGFVTDFDFMLRVARRHSIVVADEPCAIYTVHGGSSSIQEPLLPLLAAVPRMLLRLQTEVADRDDHELIAKATLAKLRRYVVSAALMEAARNRYASVAKAATALEDHLSAPLLARTLRLAANTGLVGVCARTLFRAAEVRWLMRRLRYRRYDRVVAVGSPLLPGVPGPTSLALAADSAGSDSSH